MTKERLAELIEQGASVYTTSGYHTELKPCEYLVKENNVVTIKCECYIGLSEIYETEAEATHHAKYGNITRTEKMPMPPLYEKIGHTDIQWIARCIDCDLELCVRFGKISMAKWYSGNECEEVIYKADLTNKTTT